MYPNIRRSELNNRFIQVFSQLVKDGKIVKSCRERSKSAFAKKLGTKGHIIDLFLSKKRNITYEQAKKLCAYYDINEAYMFQGEGAPYSDPIEKTTTVGEPSLAPTYLPSQNILFTNINAFAGDAGVGADPREENKRFHIPGLSGDLVAFNINGTSMHPTIHPGDMVICEPLAREDFHKVTDNEIYAVVTNESIWVKRIQKCVIPNNQPCLQIKLISDNYQEYDPFVVELTDVRSLLKIKKRITGLS